MSPAYVTALILFAVMAIWTVRSVGLVGEVAGSWGLDAPPAVVVSIDPLTWADPTRAPHVGHRLGGSVLALDASQVRPLESIALGSAPASNRDGLRLPLLVNTYTGGLPDWPARLATWATRTFRAGLAVHLLLGMALLGLVWWVLRTHRAVVGAGAAVLWLASDWNFLFYRKVLGGTELALLAASALVVHGLWDRRWAGGGRWPWVLALAVGLGLHAKITFAAVLIAALCASLLTRWDRGNMGAPRTPSRRSVLVGLGLLGFFALPSVLGIAHHALAVPSEPHLNSHDFLGLQLGRVFEGLAGLFSGESSGPARETPMNLLWFLAQPLTFFEHACGATVGERVAYGRVAGFAVLLVGTAMAWLRRSANPASALLRWMSIATPLAMLGLFFANRDIHHQAQLTVWLAIWGGLAVDELASRFSPPRSPRRAFVCLVLLLPWMSSGVRAAVRTDAVIDTCTSPLFREAEQAQVVDLLREHGASRVVLSSYDLYGTLDLRAPELDLLNGWGLMSRAERRRDAFAGLVALARGGHLLLVRPNMPTIYDMNPSDRDLARAAEMHGLSLRELGKLEDAQGVWARLVAVE